MHADFLVNLTIVLSQTTFCHFKFVHLLNAKYVIQPIN